MRKFAFLLTIVIVIWFGADIIVHAQTNPQSNLPPAIVEFSTDTAELVLADLENTGISLEFYWQAVNIEPDHRIFIEQYQLNDWIVVAGAEELLPANGTAEILAAHPQNFTAPTYRIVVRDDQGNILTQRILVIPYAINATHTPTIEAFAPTETTVYADDLASGISRVDLQWTVQNRLPNTNLVFQQVLSETETINIELPRYELWIPSISHGAVAPESPLSGNTLTIRLEIIDMLSGEIYETAQVMLQIVPGGSPPSVTTLPPAVPDSTVPTILPQIEFSGSQTNGERGDNINLTWHVTNAVSVQIEEQAILGEPAQLMFEDALLDATLPFMVPLYASQKLTWILTATNAQGQSTVASFSVNVPCPESVNFTINCPYVDETVTLAY